MSKKQIGPAMQWARQDRLSRTRSRSEQQSRINTGNYSDKLPEAATGSHGSSGFSSEIGESVSSTEEAGWFGDLSSADEPGAVGAQSQPAKHDQVQYVSDSDCPNRNDVNTPGTSSLLPYDARSHERVDHAVEYVSKADPEASAGAATAQNHAPRNQSPRVTWSQYALAGFVFVLLIVLATLTLL